jgi:peptidoglycan/xylan/chitin deacetylase (PgdA/CDA1 family)
LLKKILIFVTSLVLIGFIDPCYSQKRILALTIDDLPFVGESKNFHLNMLLDALKNNNVPATGFIIASEVTPQVEPMLHKFHEAGLGLGNHTFSHLDLNKVNAETYIHEIDSADRLLSSFMTEPKFFRFPYLAEGTGPKKEKIQQFLSAKHYQVAPVSIDSKDFIFNQLLLNVPETERRHFLTVLKPCYLDFIWQQTLKAEEHSRSGRHSDEPQILLIHANLLNAYVLPDIINLYKQNGYNFVSLQHALGISDTTIAKTDTPQEVWTEPSDESFMAWD